MRFNLQANIRKMSEEEKKEWKIDSHSNKYIITVSLDEAVVNRLSDEIESDNKFYKVSNHFEAIYDDKVENIKDIKKDILDIFSDDFLEAVAYDIDCYYLNYEIFECKFDYLYKEMPENFVDDLKNFIDEANGYNLVDIIDMGEREADNIINDVISLGHRDIRIISKINPSVFLDMSYNIYGSEEDNFDMVFYDVQGFEHQRVPNWLSKDKEEVEAYEKLWHAFFLNGCNFDWLFESDEDYMTKKWEEEDYTLIFFEHDIIQEV